jgi:hypothetical protein
MKDQKTTLKNFTHISVFENSVNLSQQVFFFVVFRQITQTMGVTHKVKEMKDGTSFKLFKPACS